ncbi:hypothetical protein ACOMHN_061528 [Nucella lapillus]
MTIVTRQGHLKSVNNEGVHMSTVKDAKDINKRRNSNLGTLSSSKVSKKQEKKAALTSFLLDDDEPDSPC